MLPPSANHTLIRTLTDLRAHRVVLLLADGNRGLGLVHDGARLVLAQLGIRPLEITVADARGDVVGDALIVSAGGVFCGRGAKRLVGAILHLAPRFRRVVLLPASFDPSLGPVRRLLKAADKRYAIFCREYVSMDRLRPYDQVFGPVFLGHDLGFHSDLTPWDNCVGEGEGGIFRRDGYGAADGRFALFEKDDPCIGRMHEREMLLDHVAAIGEVHTDRLQVAIAAARLGRQVVLYRSRSFKNQAVYEHSLKTFRNVSLAGAFKSSLRRYVQNLWWRLLPG